MFVEYSQFHVYGGPGPDEDGRITFDLPGLAGTIGSQCVVVLTGLQMGYVRVSASALDAPPVEVDQAWESIAEVDLDCPDRQIVVCDMMGPPHPELGELDQGWGRYSLRLHARNRKRMTMGETDEEHRILVWPVEAPSPPQLLKRDSMPWA